MLDQYRLSLLDQQSMRLSVLLARHSALFGPPVAPQTPSNGRWESDAKVATRDARSGVPFDQRRQAIGRPPT